MTIVRPRVPMRRKRKRKQKTAFFESLEPRVLLAGDPILDGEPLIISEFVAASSSTLSTRTRSSGALEFEGAFETPDWIEILNVSEQRMQLGGMHLTDATLDRLKWSFPVGTELDPGEFLVVFASGKDIQNPTLDELGYLHTNFRLDSNGEYLAITDGDGRAIHEFTDNYPTQRTNVSYAVPMSEQTLLALTPVEYFVPTDDSLEPNWRLPGFENPDFVTDATSPLGFDRGGGDVEPGESIGAELVDRSRLDFARGSMVILESRPFTETGRVHEWSFYSEKTNAVTPLIFRSAEDGFEIVGIGATRTSDGSGVQTFPFEMQEGSDAVESEGYFFGVKDGDNATDTSGAIVWANSDTDSVLRINGPLSGSINVGQQFNGGRSFGRVFSVQATTIARLEGPINTNLDAAMADASSLYVRYPFSMEQTAAVQRLLLNVRYDDGFVAYLNGQEIARRNAPNEVHFDSTASSNHGLTDANRFEEINVSQFIGQLHQGDNVLAIHAFNDRQNGEEFLIDASLLAVEFDSIQDIGFAAEPTPGKTNSTVLPGFVADLSFSHSRGFYDQPIQFQLGSDGFPAATIYYTTDGTAPTVENPTSILYDQAFEISDTTVLRAASYQDGFLPSSPQSHTFVFPEDVKRQETLHADVINNPVWGPQFTDSIKSVPTMSLITAEPITVEGEIFTSAELIFPDGTGGFQIDAGVEVFGGTAVSFPKRSMRLSFKNIYGPTVLDFDVFGDGGVSQFNQLLLRPGSHDTPFWNGAAGVGNYMRNRWVNDRQLEMGKPAPRGQFVHLYLNGTYWGQYQLMERPNANFMASNFGGQPEDYDALNRGNAIDGDEVAWNALLDSLDKGYDEVKKYLDVENYADYILLQFYGGNNIDWRADSNWMAARKREPGAGFQFFGWDSDLVLRIGANVDIVNFGGPGFLWTRNGGLRQYPEFLKLLAERAQLHFFEGGIFTDQRVIDSIDQLAGVMRPGIVAETARWGAGRYTPDTWEAAVAWMKDTYTPENGPSRADTVIEQMRHAGIFPLSDRPQFLVGGESVDAFIPAGSELAMTAPEGEIYYTLDGSDPWNQSPVVEFRELIPENSQVKAFIPTDDSLQNDWRQNDFDDADWIQGQAGVGYDTTGELNSRIGFDIQDQMKDVNASAYLRIPFQVSDMDQIDTLQFSMRYDDGFVAYLNGTEVARRNAPSNPAWNSRSSQVRANIEAIEFESFNLSREKGLLLEGDNVLSIHALNTMAANVDLLMTPRLQAGKVTSIGVAESATLFTGPVVVPDSTLIQARTIIGDQWSTLRSATSQTEPLALRVSEVMYHPADSTEREFAAGFTDSDEFEFIELVNISDSAIDLTNVRFVQSEVGGQTEGIEFNFGRGALQTVRPGERILVVENINAFQFRYGNQLPVTGEWSGGLSNNSEQITLTVDDQILQQFRYDDGWYLETDGNGSSLQILDETNPDFASWNVRASWQPSTTVGGTPGRADDERVPGDSNEDGTFDSRDLILVFQAGEFEDQIPHNSTFQEGDWNGDGDFTTRDFVFAFRSGNYVLDAMPLATETVLDIAGALAVSQQVPLAHEREDSQEESRSLRRHHDLPLADRTLLF